MVDKKLSEGSAVNDSLEFNVAGIQGEENVVIPSTYFSPKYAYAYPYINDSPSETSDQDTGVLAANLPPETAVQVVCLFQVDTTGNRYAITISIDNYLAQLDFAIRQLRSAEPVTGSGDIAMAAWIDETSGTYRYSLDVDGSGKTLLQTSLLTKSLV